MDPEVEAAVDRLFALPLGEFTAARNELAKERKASGKPEDAQWIKALPKPNISAWAVNQLWWNHRDSFAALLDAGERVRRTQEAGAGPSEQQTAHADRRAALRELMLAAETVLEAGGHGKAMNTLRRISTTLEAAAAHGDAQPRPGPGRLSDDLSPPGFEVLAGAQNVTGFATAFANAKPAPPPPDAGAELAAAKNHAEQAGRALDEAQRIADVARQGADKAGALHREAKIKAKAAQEAADDAEREARRLRREADAQDEEIARREKAVAEANAAVKQLS